MSFIIGGNERVVVGWGEYLTEKRRLKWKLNKERYNNYYNKKLIYPEDIIQSILNFRKNSEIHQSINYLINLLKQYEAKYYSTFGESVRLPILTSDRLNEFLENDFTNYEKIMHINELIKKFVDMLGFNVNIEEIPLVNLQQNKKPVLVLEDDEVMNLETELLPDINNIEKGQGLLAVNCDKISQYLKDLLKSEIKAEILEDITNSHGHDGHSHSHGHDENTHGHSHSHSHGHDGHNSHTHGHNHGHGHSHSHGHSHNHGPNDDHNSSLKHINEIQLYNDVQNNINETLMKDHILEQKHYTPESHMSECNRPTHDDDNKYNIIIKTHSNTHGYDISDLDKFREQSLHTPCEMYKQSHDS